MSTSSPDSSSGTSSTTTDTTTSAAPTPAPAPSLYTVNRSQDGAVVRAELSIDEAKSECNILNAQARIPAGQGLDGRQIYGSMFHGEISRYEVRSADGLVIA